MLWTFRNEKLSVFYIIKRFSCIYPQNLCHLSVGILLCSARKREAHYGVRRRFRPILLGEEFEESVFDSESEVSEDCEPESESDSEPEPEDEAVVTELLSEGEDDL